VDQGIKHLDDELLLGPGQKGDRGELLLELGGGAAVGALLEADDLVDGCGEDRGEPG